MSASLFRFGSFDLDVGKRLLWKSGNLVALGPKVIDTLAVLVEKAGELVTKDELMDRLWPERVVEEANLTQNVYRLRRALAAGGLGGAIETMACRGYRFSAPVERVTAREEETVRHTGTRQSPNRWILIGLAAASSMMLVGPGARPQSDTAYARLSPQSQRLYTLGRYHWNLRSDAEQVKDGLKDFQEVVKRDPDNPLGYSGVADTYIAMFDNYCDSKVENCHRLVALANDNASRAVAVDPESAEAHTSLAMTINAFTNQDERSEAEFLRAIALDPNYALAHHWYGNSLLVRGLIAQAMVQHKEALALEPVSPATYAWLAEDAYFSRQYGDAISYARESLAIYPNRHPTRVLLGLAYEQLGDTKAAIASFDRISGPERNALVAAMYARTGKRAEAMAMLRAIDPKEAFKWACTPDIALAWIALGDKDRGYTYMRATPPPNRIEHNFLALDPRLDPLRSDSRFKQWTAPD